MQPVVNFKFVRKPFSKDHPPFVILHHQKLIFISKEAGEVLDVSNPAWPLRQSTTRSGIKRNSLPVISSNAINEDLAFIRKSPSFFYPSRLMSNFIKLNRPETISFTYWALRELLPIFVKQKKCLKFTRSGLKVMGLVDEKQSQYIRQVLVAPGGIEARVGSRISGIDEDSNLIEGGEPCPNP